MPLSSSWTRTLDSQSRNSGSSPDSGTTHAGVAEWVDAPDSKSGPRKRVWVRVPPSVLYSPLAELGRRGGLKIPWPVMVVRVRVP